MAFQYKGTFIQIFGLLVLLCLLAACGLGGEDQPTETTNVAIETLESTQELATAPPLSTPTPTPRRLTICMAKEPDTLFLYGGDSIAQRHVLQAIYDGPIDRVGYQLQPVILEKLPSLADGDAVLEPVPVAAGDVVVNSAGQLVQLQSGERVRPSGCTNSDCAVAWDGGPLELPQLSATFTLSSGLSWSDGTPLTAADSVYSYQLASQCESDFGNCGGLGLSNRNGWEMLPRSASYTALDERSVKWVGVPGFLDPGYQANFFIPLPKHQLEQYSLQDLFAAPEAARQPMGWGPYIIQDWLPGDSITLHANPYYSRTSVQFDELLFRFLGTEFDSLREISTKACDIIEHTASHSSLESSLDEINQGVSNGQLEAYFAAGPVWEHLDFGILPLSYDDGYQPGVDRPDFFSDLRVRQAFALCMDREKIVSDVLSGLSTIPASFLPAEHPLFLPGMDQLQFDPQAGSLLLQEVGWVDYDADPLTARQALGIQGIPDGTPLVVTFSASTAEQRQEAGLILTESLAECGIQVEPAFGSADMVYAPGPEGPVFGRRFDLAQFAWSSSGQFDCQIWTSRQIPGDPILNDGEGNAVYPYGWGGVNAGGFNNYDYDRACEAAKSSLPGQPDYVEKHQAVQSLFGSQLPVIPLYQHVNLALSRADMCGFSYDPSAFSELWNIENYDHGSGCP
jgi:peptide/nickel transport system substrate-binding protein